MSDKRISRHFYDLVTGLPQCNVKHFMGGGGGSTKKCMANLQKGGFMEIYFLLQGGQRKFTAKGFFSKFFPNFGGFRPSPPSDIK